MIKISFRDSFADLPPSLIKKKIEEQTALRKITYVIDPKETIELIPQLKELFEKGIIESYPNHEGAYIEWRDKSGQEHRENNLPSTVWYDKDDIGFKVHGRLHRTNGPAWIYGQANRIAWYLNDVEVVREDGAYFYKNHNLDDSITKKEYEQIIRNNFPLAGERFYFKDWEHEFPK